MDYFQSSLKHSKRTFLRNATARSVFKNIATVRVLLCYAVFRFKVIHLYHSDIKKPHKQLRVTGLCEGNAQVTGEFTAQMASNVVMNSFTDIGTIVSVNPNSG